MRKHRQTNGWTDGPVAYDDMISNNRFLYEAVVATKLGKNSGARAPAAPPLATDLLIRHC